MRRREFIAGLGGAAAWPMVARAQRDVYTGSWGSKRSKLAKNLSAARRHKLGRPERSRISEGKNVSEIEYRWAEGIYDRLPGCGSRSSQPPGGQSLWPAGRPAVELCWQLRQQTRTIPDCFHKRGSCSWHWGLS